jgi:hypothetical protein
VNIVKGNVGPGCLSMPYTFAEGGLVPSLLILFVFAPACIYCMNLLVYSKHRILASNSSPGVTPSKLNFEEVRDVKPPASLPLFDCIRLMTARRLGCSMRWGSWPTDPDAGRDDACRESGS